MDKITVAIVNYNTCALLRECLLSIYTDMPGEVIVVDNASGDGSPDMVRAEFPACRLIVNKTNGGYGWAANLAIRASSSPYVLLLNSDTRTPRGMMQVLEQYLEDHPRVGVVGPRNIGFDKQLQPTCYPFPILPELFLEFSGINQLVSRVPLLREISPRTSAHTRTQAVDWVVGAALAIRRDAFDAVDGFDPSFYMYFEETDLCYRMRQKGWQTHFMAEAEITHMGGASTQQRQTEMAVQFYSSLAHFYQQHYAPAHKAGMVALIRGITVLRWLRDAVSKRLNPNSQRRAVLARSLAAWRIILISKWERQANE